MNEIICGNCIDVMATFPDNYIDLTVTSPPYDNLRDYNGYDFDFEGITRQLYRVMKDGGVVVWVVGDATINGSETGTSFRQALYFKDIGFNLHDTMIYYKKSGGLPHQRRYTGAFEYMFVFSKGKHKTFNPISDRINKSAGRATGKKTVREKDGSLSQRKSLDIPNVGQRFNVWEYYSANGVGQTDKIAYQHPATFPEQLAHDHIITWSNEGDLILDPMCGSGTTCKMAAIKNRNYIGIDISEEYCEIARKRIAETELQVTLC